MEEHFVDPSVLKELLRKLLQAFPSSTSENNKTGVVVAFILEVLDNPQFKETAIAEQMLLLVVSAIKEASPDLSAGSTSIDEAVNELWSLVKDLVSPGLVPPKNLVWFLKQTLSGERGMEFYSSLGGAVSVIHTWLVEAEAVELLETALKAAQLAEQLQVVVPQPPSIVPSSTLDDPGY